MTAELVGLLAIVLAPAALLLASLALAGLVVAGLAESESAAGAAAFVRRTSGDPRP